MIQSLQSRPDAAASPTELQDLLPAVLRADEVFRPKAAGHSGSTFRYALEKFKVRSRSFGLATASCACPKTLFSDCVFFFF